MLAEKPNYHGLFIFGWDFTSINKLEKPLLVPWRNQEVWLFFDRLEVSCLDTIDMFFCPAAKSRADSGAAQGAAQGATFDSAGAGDYESEAGATATNSKYRCVNTSEHMHTRTRTSTYTTSFENSNRIIVELWNCSLTPRM